MNPVPQITDLQLALSVLFVLTAGVISTVFRLGLARSLAWGTVRTFVQLMVVGWALTFIFRLQSTPLVVAVITAMCLFAVRTMLGRVKHAPAGFSLLAFASLAASTFLVAFVVSGLIIGARPVTRASVMIPIAGMILGNTLNAVSLAAERLFSELSGKSDEVEMRLALGATPWEAARPLIRLALKAGMTPAINSLMAAGLVFLPGMMVGQILAGADPQGAVRYQIVVMVMLAASAALASLGVIGLGYRRAFEANGALKSRFWTVSRE